MPRKRRTHVSAQPDLGSLYTPEIRFGEYMRLIREAQDISLRALAQQVNKTPTYISDIENGNNRPPDKELLNAIISSLDVNSYPKIVNNLFDLAAFGRGDIPADVKTFIIENPETIILLRSLQSSTNKALLADLVSRYCKGGTTDDIE